MPFVSVPKPVRLSDLVFHEVDPASRYSRESVNITPPANPVKLGTVFYRAKTELNPYAPYTILANGPDINDDNEYIVIFGDEYGFAESFTAKTVQTTTFNAVGFIRGQVQLKDYYIKESLPNLTDVQFNSLRTLLKRQGVVVETTYGDIE